MADLPHYHLGSDLASKIKWHNATWGCAIPQEPWVMLPWVTPIRFEQKTCIWGCSAWDHPFLPTTDQPSLCHRALTKKALAHLLQGPESTTCLLHLPRRNKRLFSPSLQLLNTSKRGINTYRPSLFPSSVPSPCDYVSALLSLSALHIRNSPHSPQRELQNWISQSQH